MENLSDPPAKRPKILSAESPSKFEAITKGMLNHSHPDYSFIHFISVTLLYIEDEGILNKAKQGIYRSLSDGICNCILSASTNSDQNDGNKSF